MTGTKTRVESGTRIEKKNGENKFQEKPEPWMAKRENMIHGPGV